MSTETQFGNVDDAISGFRTLANFGRGSSMTGALHDACDLLEKMQLTQSSQATEIEALKAKLASYEANGVTCQTFGHVVGACAECNTHEESKEAEMAALKADIATYVRAASEQATEIEALRKDAELWQYWKPWLERRLGDLTPYNAAMQNKEAS